MLKKIEDIRFLEDKLIQIRSSNIDFKKLENIEKEIDMFIGSEKVYEMSDLSTQTKNILKIN